MVGEREGGAIMGTIVPKLFNIYRAAGYEPITG